MSKQNPNLWIVRGGVGSGKSTLIKSELEPNHPGAIVIDADRLWLRIPADLAAATWKISARSRAGLGFRAGRERSAGHLGSWQWVMQKVGIGSPLPSHHLISAVEIAIGYPRQLLLCIRLGALLYSAAVVACCPFCNIESARVWLETEHALAIPDIFPVANGHMLVVPRTHVSTIYELSMSEQNAIWDLVRTVREDLVAEFKPDGFNIGFNDGLAAGQTLEHAHIHVIPRRRGDVPDPRGGIRWVIPNNARIGKNKNAAKS